VNKFLKLVVSISLPFIAGGIGSYFTYPSIGTWYAALDKPFFNPPNFLFGPVWTILYILMGISLFLIWTQKPSPKQKLAIKYFLIQLVLNTTWSITFFGLRNPFLAFINIILLWIFIYLTLREFLVIKRPAGYLLLPYICWVSFAALLNLSIVILN
jgi:tryptophan-rich sensory protein